MKLKNLKEDDAAVSPVIGVILMVAITVILAAVIGTFVLQLGNQVGDTSPTASTSFDQSVGNTDEIEVVHDGGDSLNSDNIEFVYQNRDSDTDEVDGSYAGTWADGDGEITAGESVLVSLTDDFDSGDKLQVVWKSDDGETSATLAEYEVA
jgi:flagellin-like protein